ncbi:MAG: MFS transporter, partial [Bacteroidota bacterium]
AVDRFSNNSVHYRKWIFTSEIFYAGIIFSIGFLNLQYDFQLIIALVVIAFVASATQDIATDAYAILILKVKERGMGNSMQSSGSFTGTLVGSGVLLVIYYHFGWQLLLFSLSLFVIIALIPLIFYQRGKIIPKPESEKPSMKDIATFFTQKGIHRHIFTLVFYYSGIIGILTMLKPYLVDLGYNSGEIGTMVGIMGTGFAAISALGAGAILKKVHRKSAFFLFLIPTASAGIYFRWLSAADPTDFMIYTGVFLVWMAYGFSSVLIYTSSMDRVRPGREGTDFTIQIVLTHLSSLIISVFSGFYAGKFGYSGLFTAEIALCAATYAVIIFFNPRKDKYEKPIKANK